MLLTIAIPTYNRNEILLKNLLPLLSQLNARCKLLILDNGSPTPVEATVRDALQQFPDLDWEIKRHRANIGANANIMRCFEQCQTEWLWVLGDDDTVLPDAVTTVLQEITAHPECLCFNFSSEHYMRPAPLTTRGQSEFIAAIESFWAVLFISPNIYRVRDFQANLRIGYRYEYSHAPHMAMLLAALGETGYHHFSERQIVHWNAPQEEQQWPVLNLALAIMTLLELPMNPASRRRLAAKITATAYLELLVLQLLLMAVRDGNSQSALYLYDQMCSRLYYFDRNPRRKLKTFLYRLMLRFPRCSYHALTRLKGRDKASKHVLQDLFERI